MTCHESSRISFSTSSARVFIRDASDAEVACAASSPARRRELVEALVALLDENGLDGLDIDWECPGDHPGAGDEEKARDWANYGLLMRELAAAFLDRGYVLSLCTKLGYRMPPGGLAGAFHAADFINSMAYGQHCSQHLAADHDDGDIRLHDARRFRRGQRQAFVRRGVLGESVRRRPVADVRGARGFCRAPVDGRGEIRPDGGAQRTPDRL